jgi:hypothetical protein
MEPTTCFRDLQPELLLRVQFAQRRVRFYVRLAYAIGLGDCDGLIALC